VKVSELKNTLKSISNDTNVEVVTGEEWLPEHLINAKLNDNLLFLTFDNAPDELEHGTEARGFVEHEMDLLRLRLSEVLNNQTDNEKTLDALLAFFLVGHEMSSSDFVEFLHDMSQTPLDEMNCDSPD
jgi:hypothetical protein